jgi:SNF2 family DNA or RNA helicase
MSTLPPLPQQVLMRDFVFDKSPAMLMCGAGLGKTRAILDAREMLADELAIRRTLVVAPLRVAILTWPAEIKKWYPHLKVANLRTEEGIAAWHARSADIYIINFEMLQKFEANHIRLKRKLPADFLVIDEISKMKAHDSKRGGVLRRIRTAFRWIVGMTGTPASNSHMDLYAQYRILDGGERLGTSVERYRQCYFDVDYSGFVYTIKEGAKEQIEALIADMTLTLRSEDWLDIPPMNVEDIDVSLPKEALAAYRQIEKDFLTEIGNTEIVALSAAAKISKMRQITSGSVISVDETNGAKSNVFVHDAKIKALKKLRDQISKRPVLVITNFIEEKAMILRAFPDAAAFDDTKLDDWNAGKIPMWVANVKSVSHGLQMQGTCHDLIWFSLTYSQDDYTQTIARIYRTGQKNVTNVYRLMVPQTVDWAIAEVLRAKWDNEQGLLKALAHHIKTIADDRKSS